MKRNAMILAAGIGKRMRPLTLHTPKPLISVAGKSMLERVFDHLKIVGISHIVINAHHLATQIIEAAQKIYPNALLSREEILLETGGGIKKALPLLGNEAFFALNGDNVWTGEDSLILMDSTWEAAKMDALLLLIPREKAYGYQGKGDFFLAPNQRLTRPEPGGEAPYVYAGVQLVSPQLFKESPKGSFSMNVLWDKALKNERLYGVVHQGEWFHISTPEDLQRYEPDIARLDK